VPRIEAQLRYCAPVLAPHRGSGRSGRIEPNANGATDRPGDAATSASPAKARRPTPKQHRDDNQLQQEGEKNISQAPAHLRAAPWRIRPGFA
jgi:hypothetical protein